MMRIITGKARGVRLETPAGETTRPTAEKVKEALFSSLGQEVVGARVLDLFAGSGQLALEALSRGAVSAVMCDTSEDACKAIQKNIEKTRLEGAKLIKADLKKSLAMLSGQNFDLVFLDPPYKKRLIPTTLDALEAGGHVAPGGIIVCEDEISEPYQKDGYTLRKFGHYGRIYITILQRE